MKFASISKTDSTTTFIKTVLSHYGVRVTKSTLRNRLHTHPNFPSLLSISDILKQFGISNIVTRLEKTKLVELDTPFLAHINNQNEPLKFIVKKDTEEIEWLIEAGITRKQNNSHFIKEWSGIVMLLDSKNKTDEHEYIQKRRNEILRASKIPLAAFLAFTTVVLVCIHRINTIIAPELLYFYSAMVMTKSSGVIASSLLIWYEVDKKNSILRALCSLNSKGESNCGAVLNSKGAKVFNTNLSWSEIGFYYFFGGLLYLMITPYGNIEAFCIPILLSIIVSVFIPYSIYYQWKVVQQWCLLCLVVQIILLVELLFSLMLPYGDIPPFSLVSFYASAYVCVSFICAIFIWRYLRLLIAMKRQYDYLKREAVKLKTNPKVFYALSETLPITEFENIRNLGITLGNTNAKNTLLMICNPYCSACGSAYTHLELLLEKKLNLKIKIVFSSPIDKGGLSSLPAKHLIAISKKREQIFTKKAIRSWYSFKWDNYFDFSNYFPITEPLSHYDHEIYLMNKWVEKVGIYYTPFYFLNDHHLPIEYNIQDLPYLLCNLDESSPLRE